MKNRWRSKDLRMKRRKNCKKCESSKKRQLTDKLILTHLEPREPSSRVNENRGLRKEKRLRKRLDFSKSWKLPE